MSSAYDKIISENLSRAFYGRSPEILAGILGGSWDERCVRIRALGRSYEIRKNGLFVDAGKEEGPGAVVVSLYAARACPDPLILEPFRSFKDLPGSMPYHGAFSSNSEKILVPWVQALQNRIPAVADIFSGTFSHNGGVGDFSATLFPLPKVCLKYIFYLPDEDFPASVNCLVSSNAMSFLPLDGIADLAEYTSRSIVSMARGG